MRTWLFRPFERIAGTPALALGLLVMLLTAWLAARNGLHSDGVLDLHAGPPASLMLLIVEGLTNWLSLGLALLGAAWWLNRRRFRILDLLATQALARWPLLPAVGYLSIRPVSDEIERISARLMAAMPTDARQFMPSAEFLIDAMWLFLISLPVLVMIGWMVWLMVHAYLLVADLKGPRPVLSFIAALALAEILSKTLIYWMASA
ncbi:MAG: hypothetical protein RQ741_02165 [Wenzhouxiangellaceae bacterium]|nr:hypothetical protein [Wenzhouxiangellaceae bacterium]